MPAGRAVRAGDAAPLGGARAGGTATGGSPWVVDFVILLVAPTWIHPTQSDPNQSEFVRYMQLATERELLTDRQALVTGSAVTGVALLAVASSLPVWREMGLL